MSQPGWQKISKRSVRINRASRAKRSILISLADLLGVSREQGIFEYGLYSLIIYSPPVS